METLMVTIISFFTSSQVKKNVKIVIYEQEEHDMKSSALIKESNGGHYFTYLNALA